MEIAALGCYRGHGSARLLEADMDACVFLLERLRPGDTLANLKSDEQATDIGGETIKRLWRPAPNRHEFPSLERWTQALRKNPPLGESALVEKAVRICDELLRSAGEPVLLHGDLHHFNILSSERGWLAIDPKGVVGDPAYDAAPFMFNPCAQPREVYERRATALARILDVPRERILRWSFVHRVLSASWDIEDNAAIPGAAESIATAKVFDDLV